jgi:hypothetical protein
MIRRTSITMDAEIVYQNLAWPSYFDVDVLVYVEDWTIDGQRLILGTDTEAPPSVVLIDSITPLPDDLLFIRGRYAPADARDVDAPETYYGIAARWQYQARKTAQIMT